MGANNSCGPDSCCAPPDEEQVAKVTPTGARSVLHDEDPSRLNDWDGPLSEPPSPAKEAGAKSKPATAGLQFVFLSDTGVKYITLPHKPIGMQFAKKMPIVITDLNENSKAKELGVKLGWELKSIGGADLTAVDSYAAGFEIIKSKLQTLPVDPTAS